MKNVSFFSIMLALSALSLHGCYEEPKKVSFDQNVVDKVRVIKRKVMVVYDDQERYPHQNLTDFLLGIGMFDYNNENSDCPTPPLSPIHTPEPVKDCPTPELGDEPSDN